MNMLILFFLILLNSSFASENYKIALIDVGINLSDLKINKLVYSRTDNCSYNYDIELNENCIKSIHDENHANIVYNILQHKLMDNSVLSFQYANQEKSLKMLHDFRFPSSGKDVWIKKQLLKQHSSQIANAIGKAIDNKAIVINISLADRGFYTKELELAIQQHPNILFVFAAGNSGDNLNLPYNKTFPCSLKFSNTLCVGALDPSNKIATYSNYGEDVDLYVKPKYEEGTSFASPQIANEAFLLLKKSNNLNFVISILKSRHKYKSN
jgi:hypothetical protein